jgi:uncharacterized protein (TIGR02594 family)
MYDLKALIAQTYLLELGHYDGKLDGEWGPRSQAAAAKWDDAELLRHVPKSTPAGGEYTPYNLAGRHIGTKEIPGKADNPIILRWLRSLMTSISSEETPWCSAFVNAMAAEAGYERSGALNARSWMDVGIEIPLKYAQPGDVVILWRVAKDSWQGHVAFFVKYHASAQTLELLGGNQADSVSVAFYPVSKLLSIRRLRTLDQLQGSARNV